MRFEENSNSLAADFFFSEREQEILLCRLWELLKRQADKYNGTDSTSISVEKAQQLLESMLYTIGVVIECGAGKEEILKGDISFLLNRGQRLLREKQKAAKVAWKLLCQELPGVRNVYYLSTVKSLGTFFEKYDIYYKAHEIPCSMDYWLLCPVPEEKKGVSFMEEYIRRLQIENDFLNCFDTCDLVGLYRDFVPDYEEALFNLCEPVLANAVGLEMLGEDVFPLNISAAQRKRIGYMLDGMAAEEMQACIDQAVLFLCQKLGMTTNEEKDYLVNAAAGLAARVFAALKQRDLSHIFISFI